MTPNTKLEQPTRSSRPSSKDWDARVGAFLSLGLAAASLIVSCVSYREQKHQFDEVQSEKLGVTLDPLPYVPLRVTKIKLGKDGRVVIASWKLTLSNTGQQRLSVTKYEISEGERPGQRVYTGLSSGMFDSRGQLVALPLTMDPGDSKVFTLSVGMLVNEVVGNILAAKADANSGFVLNPALVLAQKNLDLFGNRVEYKQYATGATFFNYTNKAGPTYWFAAKTGRNKIFYGVGHAEASSPELEHFGFGGKEP